jgi:hypothetical protein
MLITLVPIYQAEVAPPATRGFLVAQTGRSNLDSLDRLCSFADYVAQVWFW